jgi:2-polyprenyl-3-methyl-5-hydroxy-6-metoxy-1,4-benzoquinol methylase
MDVTKHDEQVRDFFDTWVSSYDAFYEEPTLLGRWFNRVFRKAVYLRRDGVSLLAKEYDCKSILDVGCGSGRNTVLWAQQGIEQLLGIDVSAEMIRLATEVAKHAGVADRCQFQHLDFMAAQPTQKYDMVVACGVFDYVQDAVSFLRHMAAHANRVIYGSFPGKTLVRTPLRKLRYALRGCPTHFYGRRELDALFDAVGFGRREVKAITSGYLAWAVRE